jgi:hypothetical protein
MAGVGHQPSGVVCAPICSAISWGAGSRTQRRGSAPVSGLNRQSLACPDGSILELLTFIFAAKKPNI